MYAANGAGIHRSADAGLTWSQVYTADSSVAISELAVVPGSPPTVYASTSSGLLKSGDGGNTWSWIYQALEADPGGTAFTYNRLAPNELYYSADRAIMRSVDAGESWTLLSDVSLSPEILLLGGDGFKALVVGESGISVWSESDGWRKGKHIYRQELHFRAVHPSNSSVYASSWPDLLLSPDHGSTWSEDDAAPSDGERLFLIPPIP